MLSFREISLVATGAHIDKCVDIKNEDRSHDMKVYPEEYVGKGEYSP
jgi:hypothetical protein